MNTTLTHETRQHYLDKGVTHLLRIRDLSDFTTYNVEVTENELYEDIAKKYKGKPDLEVMETLWFVSKEDYELTLPERKKHVSQAKLTQLSTLSDEQRENVIDRLSEDTVKALLKASFQTETVSESPSDFFSEMDEFTVSMKSDSPVIPLPITFETEPLLENTDEDEHFLIGKILDYAMPLLQKIKHYGSISDWGIRNSQEEFEMMTTFGEKLVTLLQETSFIQQDFTANSYNVSNNLVILKLIKKVEEQKEHSHFMIEDFDYTNFGEEALQIIKNCI